MEEYPPSELPDESFQHTRGGPWLQQMRSAIERQDWTAKPRYAIAFTAGMITFLGLQTWLGAEQTALVSELQARVKTAEKALEMCRSDPSHTFLVGDIDKLPSKWRKVAETGLGCPLKEEDVRNLFKDPGFCVVRLSDGDLTDAGSHRRSRDG